MKTESSKNMTIFLTAVVLCLSLCTMVSSFPRDIFLASKTIKTLSAPDFRLCKEQQKFLRSVEEKQSRWLFHLRGPITTQKKEETEAPLGIKLGGYIPHNTFVVLATKEQAEKAMSTPHVLWVGAYLPEYKLSPEFSTLTEEMGTAEKTYSRTVIHVSHDEIADEEVHSLTLTQWSGDLSSVASVSFTRLSKTSSMLKLKAEVSAHVLHNILEKLAHIHQIVWVEPVGFVEQATKWSVRLQQSANPTFTDTPTLYKTKGLSGKSQTVAILDSNFDRSNCFLPKFDTQCVEGFTGTCNTGDSAHGTAMASIIFGNSTQFPDFTGYAPDATPVLFSIGSSGNDGTETSLSITNTLAISRAYLAAAGKSARVFVAGYAGSSKKYDLFAEVADNDAVNTPQTLAIFPAGNNGKAGMSGIGSPGLSKNALVVGSSQNAIQALKNDISKVPAAGRANVQNNNLAPLFGKDSLSSFSSRGPTADMRFKPDIVFPGDVIYTATAGSCATSASSGTSLAAAGAAGAAALVADYFAQGFYPEGAANSGNRNALTSAQLKALLIASAAPITVADEVGPLGALGRMKYYDSAPNGAFGFGRVQLSNILHLNATETRKFFIDQNTTRSVGTGETHRYCINMVAGSPIKATLVWNDPLSTKGTSFALVNNLDLVVVQGATGREWRANGAETFDNTNNVEVVSFVAPTNDTYVVVVHGTSVPSGTQQVFSVVISGDLNLSDFSAAACPSTLMLECPNKCSSNGECANGVCKCKAGFNGPDCSFTLCPFNCRGTADTKATTAATGVCDLVTGKCTCDATHSGEYCQTFISNITPTQTVETGHSKTQTIMAVVLAAVAGIILGLILGFLVSKVIMERSRKQRREELLKGNQKF